MKKTLTFLTEIVLILLTGFLLYQVIVPGKEPVINWEGIQTASQEVPEEEKGEVEEVIYLDLEVVASLWGWIRAPLYIPRGEPEVIPEELPEPEVIPVVLEDVKYIGYYNSLDTTTYLFKDNISGKFYKLSKGQVDKDTKLLDLKDDGFILERGDTTYIVRNNNKPFLDTVEGSDTETRIVNVEKPTPIPKERKPVDTGRNTSPENESGTTYSVTEEDRAKTRGSGSYYALEENSSQPDYNYEEARIASTYESASIYSNNYYNEENPEDMESYQERMEKMYMEQTGNMEAGVPEVPDYNNPEEEEEESGYNERVAEAGGGEEEITAEPEGSENEELEEETEEIIEEPLEEEIIEEDLDNLITNGGFEEIVFDEADGWKTSMWLQDEGVTKIYPEWEEAYEGFYYITIENLKPNDSRIVQSVPVKSDAVYRLSCRVKTHQVGLTAIGANITVLGVPQTPIDIFNTNGKWEYVEFVGRTAPWQTEITVGARLGFYRSENTGKVSFDDIRLVELSPPFSGIEVNDFYPKNSEENILNNGSFEQADLGFPNDWSIAMFDTDAGSKIFLETVGSHSGYQYVTIQNTSPNDSSIRQRVRVEPNSMYQFSGWVKAKNVGTNERGGSLSIAGIGGSSPDVKDTNGQWQYTELVGRTGPSQKDLMVMARLGFNGSLNTGSASFDDIRFKKISGVPKGTRIIDFFNTKDESQQTK